MPSLPSVETIHTQLSSEIDTLVNLQPGTVHADTDLTVLGIDSLRFVSLVLAIESKFGVNLMKKGVTNDDTRTVRALTAAIIARHEA